jgi:serine/threonine-protein kinase
MDRLVGPSPSTPPGSGVAPLSSTGARAIPEDLLREASRRLGIMALLSAVLWFTATALEHWAIRWLFQRDPTWTGLDFVDAVAFVSIVVSLALYAWTRRTRRDPGFILNVGLAFLLYTSLAIALVWHYDVPERGYQLQPMFSWVGVILLVFAAIIPHPPVKTMVVGFCAVSMNIVSMLIAHRRDDWDYGSQLNLLLMHYPDFMLVPVAGLIAHVVTRMGQQVTRARELGSYHVGELLGRGGMGEVYRATHRMLARPAAIKFIRPEILAGSSPEAVQLAITRFQREAETAASLQSPHTVVLYDFGVTEERVLYLVMEMLEGLDLERMIRAHGPLPPGRTVHLLRQVCESLAEAHARGLVHRDIKPANIHVGRLGLTHDFVKVLDFGLVKDTRMGARGEGPAATAEGIIPGTPDYMAPEMTLSQPLDGRADLYALGCVAYYMLTGRQVFEAQNLFHMISRHLNDIPVPPSQVTDRFIEPGLERLVLACLAKNPDDRPPSALELALLLEQVPVEPWDETHAASWWELAGAGPDR